MYTWHTTGVHSPYHGCTLWLNGQYFHIKCPFTSRARTLDTTGVQSAYHGCTLHIPECTLGIPRGKILHKLGFFAGNRRETYKCYHFSTFTPQGRTLHTTDVQSAYDECTIDTPRVHTLHIMDVHSAYRRCTLWISQIHSLIMTGVRYAYYGCTFC